jgi:hypothetical protein
MASLVPWTDWKPYLLFPWLERRTVALELDSCPGVPVDASTVWTERRWRKRRRSLRRQGAERG